MMYEYIGVGSLNFPKYYETEKKMLLVIIFLASKKLFPYFRQIPINSSKSSSNVTSFVLSFP